MQKSSESRNGVVDTCAGTFSVAKACMPPRNHRTYIGCKDDPGCETETVAQLILLYAQQVLNRESGTSGEEYVCSSVEG